MFRSFGIGTCSRITEWRMFLSANRYPLRRNMREEVGREVTPPGRALRARPPSPQAGRDWRRPQQIPDFSRRSRRGCRERRRATNAGRRPSCRGRFSQLTLRLRRLNSIRSHHHQVNSHPESPAMSYLSAPRLHFAGRFRADVSTVNNYATHFQNPNDPADPGWNPSGSGSWRVSGCTVRSAIYADGTSPGTSADDPVLGLPLAQIGNARLVDLDPEQQMVSQIWGMHLQLGQAGAGPAFNGAFKVTAFSDIWFNRARVPGRGDFKASAFYQSVLTGVTWGDPLGSRLLTELKQASAPGLLSIKFNVDGFDQATRTGRIVGTIGPAPPGEPAHFVLGRQCMGASAGPVWFFPAIVDAQRGKLIADFGNALQTTSSGGPFDSTLDLQIGLLTGNGQFSPIERVPVGPAGWYEQTAGICEFPRDRALSATERARLSTTPIGVAQRTGAATSVVAAEGADGLHVRAEDFVHRMSANDTAIVTLHA